MSYWVYLTFLSGFVYWNEKAAALWNSGRIFLALTAEIKHWWFPEHSPLYGTSMNANTRKRGQLFWKCCFQSSWNYLFPEMSSVGQRMVLIIPRLQVWSPRGPFTEELELMIHVVPSISKYFESLWYCLTFDLFLVSLSHENQISTKQWPEAQNVSASALNKRV